jgi:5-oxoprolinase (ATP-hydrolysing) subunit A
MTPRTVDLNADLGEEVTDDEGLLAVVTSANVACGFHAGTPATMRAVCAGAVRRGVTLGAQVSYDDRPRFGRVELDVPAQVLREQVAEQVGVLSAIAAAEGGEVAYLKPHGALYHRVASDEVQATAVPDGSGDLPVLGMPGSLLLALAAQRGRGTRLEGFPDRGYTADGTLVPRRRPGALVEDPDEVAGRAVRMATDGVVVAVDGTRLDVPVESVCVHGDTPNAVELARAVRTALEAAGLTVTSSG